MKNIPVALGLYTVHKALEKNMKDTLLSVGEMGFTGVEFYGELVHEPNILKEALQNANLTLVGWHMEWRNLQSNTIRKTIEYCNEIGLENIIIPCLGGKWNVGHTENEESKEIWKSYVKEINKLEKMLSEYNIKLGYHNHEHEFILNYENQSVFDYLYENLSQKVIMELDTGNAIEGGVDPIAILKKYNNREIFLHCKPFSHKKGFDVLLGEDYDDNNWKQILSTCQDSNVSYLIIESESKIHDEFKSAKCCLETLIKFINA